MTRIDSPKHLEWNDEQIEKFWNYESRFPQNYFTYQFGNTLVRTFRPYLKPGMHVLDYGCGTGYLMPELLRHELKVTGVDFSGESVAAVNGQFKSHDGFTGAFKPTELLARKERFDAVIAVELVEHLQDRALQETLQTIRRFLKPEGLAMFTTPNDENLEASHVYCPDCNHVFHRWQHVRSWSRESLSRYLTDHGFPVLKAFTTDFSFSMKNGKLRFFKTILKRMLKPGEKRPHLACVCALPPD